jgi:arabinose-5-phosphate isomerase
MLVDSVLAATRARLVLMTDSAQLREAAKLMGGPGVDIVVVCGSEGSLVGVITQSDIVARISQCQGSACTTAAALVMTRDVMVCRPEDRLDQVWPRMQARGLKNLPVVDETGRPVGVLNARDLLQALLKEAESEESLLRDYVMTAGYH